MPVWWVYVEMLSFKGSLRATTKLIKSTVNMSFTQSLPVLYERAKIQISLFTNGSLTSIHKTRVFICPFFTSYCSVKSRPLNTPALLIRSFAGHSTFTFAAICSDLSYHNGPRQFRDDSWTSNNSRHRLTINFPRAYTSPLGLAELGLGYGWVKG